jgi:DsbC/DsbD-like thiol-disulfide interchange protein
MVRARCGVRGAGVLLAGIFLAQTISAQTAQRPRAEVTPAVETTPVRAGSVARLSLRVRLPKNIHVQSNKPRDPSLIPTVLTIEAPAGVTVDAVHYPKPTDLSQPNRKDPLAVYGSEFEIGVKVSLAPTVAAGDLVLPATLRYPPARASARWTLVVQRE